MSLAERIMDYCIQRRIRKGKEEKAYRMLVEARDLIFLSSDNNSLERGQELLGRASRLIRTYKINSQRTTEEFAHALSYLSET